jgi:hypothetical protein
MSRSLTLDRDQAEMLLTAVLFARSSLVAKRHVVLSGADSVVGIDRFLEKSDSCDGKYQELIEQLCALLNEDPVHKTQSFIEEVRRRNPGNRKGKVK